MKTSRTSFSRLNSQHLALAILILIAGWQGFILWTTDGTGDDGDSVMHYFYNRYAFKYPYFFIHLWAKPLLVTASCLFAQFGFTGMKLFNVLTALATAYVTFRVADQLKMKNAFLAIPFLIFMPMYFHLSFSGLTEPLFSFVIISALFLLFHKKYFWSVLLISFSPFSRPEGMFFIGLFFLYLASSRPLWKYIPWLLTGHFFYTLIGVLVFGDSWLWVFTKNPNAQIVPAYDRTGEPLHYVIGLMEVAGPPLTILTALGLVNMALRFFRRSTTQTRQYLLIISGFFSVLIMHTIFWMYGLFKSFGLLRNMLTMAPLMALIALDGMNLLLDLAGRKRIVRISITIGVALYVSVFPFTRQKYALSYPQDFNLDAPQIMSYEIADYLKENFPDHLYFYEYPTISLALGIDHFDWRIRQTLNREKMETKELPRHSLVVWDDWYAVHEGKVSLEMMQEHPLFEFHREFTTRSKWNTERKMIIFTRRPVPQ